MTPEQELMQEAVFADHATMRRLIKAIGSKISAASNAGDIIKLRVAVKAIAAAPALLLKKNFGTRRIWVRS